MIRAGTRSAARARLEKALTERLPFTTSGSLRGLSQADGPGRLQGPDREEFGRDAGSLTYVVYSYATPIYWETPERAYHPDRGFSTTTRKHQAIVLPALIGAPS